MVQLKDFKKKQKKLDIKLKCIYVLKTTETLGNGEILIENDERKLHSGSPRIQLIRE